jgi:hypothetical protein
VKPKLVLALPLSLALGALAVLIDHGVATARDLPHSVQLAVPLVTLGLAPLPGVMVVRSKGLGNALRTATVLQIAVVAGAAVAASITTGPSFINALAYMTLYGVCEFAVITIPVVAILRRIFVAE